jgi:hypothetical protein
MRIFGSVVSAITEERELSQRVEEFAELALLFKSIAILLLNSVPRNVRKKTKAETLSVAA